VRPAAAAFALSLAAWAPAAGAVGELGLRGDESGVSVAPACTLARDPTGRVTAADVRGERVRAEAVARDWVNAGFTRDVVWLRCMVRNDSGRAGAWLIDLGREVDRIDVDDGRRTVRGGRTLPVGASGVWALSTVARVELEPRAAAALVIRLQSEAPLVLRPRVWAEARYAEHARVEGLLLGLFYGVLAAAAAYNAALFASTRMRVYALYAGYLGALALFFAVVDRIVAAWITPGDARWQATSGVRFGAVTLLAVLAFSREFLDTPRRLPRTESLVGAMAVACGLLFASTFVSSAVVFKQATVALGALIVLGLVAAAVACRRRGGVEAPWFLAGVGVSAVGMLLRGGVQWGVVGYNALTENGWRVGLLVDVALLSLGLAARIRVLREAHERSRTELLAQRVAMTATLEAEVIDRTRALEAANRALAEAQRLAAHQRRMAALGQLASALAHEVANPLNFSVGGAAELARRVEALRAALDRGDEGGARAALRGAERALELVQGGNARIRGVLDGLRTYTRGDVTAPEPVDVLAVARATMALMEERFGAQGVTVTVADRELPRVRARPGEVGQVFMNLLLNAAQALPDGGVVVIDGRVRGEAVEVTVADDGPGISRERWSEVFEPYVTTRADAGGTGLGLAVSHEIARQLGGDLRLVEGARGATFALTLPVWSDAAARG